MKTVVVYDKETKEIIACINDDGKECIARKDVDFKVYNDTEPIFIELEGKVILDESSFMINKELYGKTD